MSERTRTRTRILAAALAGVSALFLLPAVVYSGDAQLDAKVHKKRLSKLRNAGGKWITHRKRFPSRCPQCRGRGKIVSSRGMRKILITCPQCDGHRAWVSRKDYRKIYYDMRSPDFRAVSGIQDQLNNQYKLAKAGKPWPTIIKRYRIQRWEMVDDTHGLVWFTYNASRTPTATYWIWVPKGTRGSKRDAWCSYDSRADGPWPQGEDDTAPTGSRDDATWEPVTPVQGQALRASVSAARLTFRAADYAARGRTLRIQLKPWADLEDRLPSERVAEDALRLHRAVFDGPTGWDTVEAAWRVRWRDAHNRIVFKTAWASRLTRSAYDAGWNGRAPVEQLKSLDWKVETHDGWRLLRGDAEQPARPRLAAAAPTSKPEPTADPAAPEPTPEEGRGVPPLEDEEPAPGVPAPRPTPTQPVRPQPPAPIPTPEPTWELPKPGSRHLRDGREGIGRMREIFELAKGVYNEGVEAHSNGAHDVWQEKLTETRAHLGDMEELWITDVAGKMPGRDEGEKDAVANEHFGEIWDEVDKLKSMVRKMSAL